MRSALVLAQRTREGERVGVLLPTSRAALVTFFALQAERRVPAMLNFSTGAASAIAACRGAEIALIVTARTFIEKAKLQALVAALEPHATILYLEDVKREIGVASRLAALMRSMLARPNHSAARANDPAVVLFTSGSEGTPKGVVLSHRNLLANRHQLASVVDISPKDIVFNALPVFHSFGLTGGLLLPLLAGVRTFLYPSPLHYRTVPELVYGVNATILFGTDTFLSGYARVADNYDFYSVRYIFAGAERVKPETRRVWFEKFGIRILEGYGATETSPALAVNTPMHFKAGTVGRLLPGIQHRLERVEGIDVGGRLFVHGPNVMLGYLRAEKPGVLEPPADGWYDTGDIVDFDAEGFVTIKGRAKRFAKVAGEMVPLGAVEDFVAKLWPGEQHAVVAVPDAEARRAAGARHRTRRCHSRSACGRGARGRTSRDLRAAHDRARAQGADPRHRQDRLRDVRSDGGRARASVMSVAARLAAGRLRFQEGQQVGVDGVGLGRGHAMRKALVGFQCAVLQQLCRQRRRIGIRHDLVVIAMHHQDRHGDLLQVFGEVRLGEGDDAVIVRLGASHHALSPPIPDHPLRGFRTRPVIAIERSSRQIVIELGSAGGELRLKSVKNLLGQPARIGRRLYH